MPQDRHISQRLLADLEALRAESRRNNYEMSRIIQAIEALRAVISKSQSETPAVPGSEIKKPDEAA